MLLYNKALDVNHTMLRMSALLIFWRTETVERDALRLFDFLVANPAHIQKLSTSREQLLGKNIFSSYKNRYQSFEPKSLFNAMKEVQILVMNRLVEIGVLCKHDNSSIFFVDISKLPEGLKELAESNDNSVSKQAIEFITSNLIAIPLTGANGLKKITNLMDYKYDAS